jgi:hypothetical protein
MKATILFLVNFLVKLHILTPIRVARLKFWYKLHRWPDFEHPKDLNEKINWLKFYGDTSMWPMLADKYAVREYVKECGLNDHLIPLIGKWDAVDDIDWEALPQQFVMKCNNGSGDVVVCRNKEELNKEETLSYFRKRLNKEYGILTGETHYALIKPCVIAEKLLIPKPSKGCVEGREGLIDYKIWCFDGKPAYIVCYSNRHDKYYCEIGVYDTEWNSHPEFLRYSSHYKKEKEPVERPMCLEQMLDIASCLSKGIPQVRVDLYEVNGKVYFGEMTLTSSGGYMAHFTQDFLDRLGTLTILT